jgi:hypothetical protein
MQRMRDKPLVVPEIHPKHRGHAVNLIHLPTQKMPHLRIRMKRRAIRNSPRPRARLARSKSIRMPIKPCVFTGKFLDLKELIFSHRAELLSSLRRRPPNFDSDVTRPMP